jgi:chromosome segregation ATPase
VVSPVAGFVAYRAFLNQDLATMTSIFYRILAGATVAMIGVSLVGCKSTGVSRIVGTSNSIADVRNEMKQGIDLLGKTRDSLDDLANNPQPDLRKQYNTFSKNVDTLDRKAQSVRSRNAAMRAKAEEYFKNWETEQANIGSKSLSKLSADRLSQARQTFTRTGAELGQAREAFGPLMEKLKDIQLYLSNDLTPRGIEAVRPTVADTTARATAVQTLLSQVERELALIQAELTPQSAVTPAK